MSKPRVKLPNTAAADEVIVIKTLISHPMESGQRKDSAGNVIPRMIINRFTCAFEGETVFSVDIEPSLSANPYLEFTARPGRSGTFTFTWVDDSGETFATEESIQVG